MAFDEGEARALSDELYRRLPAWVSGGSLSGVGARFLATSLLSSGASTAVEIGTATGFSSALLASVLDAANKSGLVDDDFGVVTIDISPQWYVDRSRATGEAAREVAPHLVDHIEFVNPYDASEVPRRFSPDSVQFLFIDANHAHPWPTLDLLLSLPALKPGAAVVLDDINLPLIHPSNHDWGAHHLFYGVEVTKEEGAFISDAHASMGRLEVPFDKASFGAQLLAVLDGNEWQTEIPTALEELARSIGGSPTPASTDSASA